VKSGGKTGSYLQYGQSEVSVYSGRNNVFPDMILMKCKEINKKKVLESSRRIVP